MKNYRTESNSTTRTCEKKFPHIHLRSILYSSSLIVSHSRDGHFNIHCPKESSKLQTIFKSTMEGTVKIKFAYFVERSPYTTILCCCLISIKTICVCYFVILFLYFL
jgi:hypothetical protein